MMPKYRINVVCIRSTYALTIMLPLSMMNPLNTHAQIVCLFSDYHSSPAFDIDLFLSVRFSQGSPVSSAESHDTKDKKHESLCMLNENTTTLLFTCKSPEPVVCIFINKTQSPIFPASHQNLVLIMENTHASTLTTIEYRVLWENRTYPVVTSERGEGDGKIIITPSADHVQSSAQNIHCDACLYWGDCVAQFTCSYDPREKSVDDFEFHSINAYLKDYWESFGDLKDSDFQIDCMGEPEDPSELLTFRALARSVQGEETSIEFFAKRLENGEEPELSRSDRRAFELETEEDEEEEDKVEDEENMTDISVQDGSQEGDGGEGKGEEIESEEHEN